VGSTEEISILDLGHRVREALGSESEVVLVPYEEAYESGFEDLPRRIPDISKIERVLGWRPTRDLGEILDDVIRAEREAAVDVSVRVA
jgi:UDP-glucose 4-epimerase